MNSDRKHFNFNDLEQWLDRLLPPKGQPAGP